jgi:hypothetical protein
MAYVCDAEKTSAVMALDEKDCFGGEDEVELLKDPCRKGLLERLEGLVLLGLGPPAIVSFVLPLSRLGLWRQSVPVVASRDETCDAKRRGVANCGLDVKRFGTWAGSSWR